MSSVIESAFSKNENHVLFLKLSLVFVVVKFLLITRDAGDKAILGTEVLQFSGMVKFMFRYRTALLSLGLVFLLSSGNFARAQDFLQELFGSDQPASSPHRASGHRGSEHFYGNGTGRERYRNRMDRAYRSQSARPEDTAGSSHSSDGARNSRNSAGGPHRDDDSASWGNGTEFCVRTCDGYFFPLIKSAQQTKQASCEYACPSAPVAYYHGASIESARNLSGEKYTSLPTAFKFREKVSPGCTCHPPEESQQHSLKIVKNDPTAHSGDIVVEQKGAFVYQGKQAVPIDRSRQVSASVRQNIHKMTAGPNPVGVIDQSSQNNPDATAVTGSVNGGLLTGAARPMGELDAASVNSGDASHIFSWATTALLFIVALSFCAVAALRLTPGLKDRLREALRDGTSAPTTIDLVEADEAGFAGQSTPSLAWVWSEYRGVTEPLDTFSGEFASATAGAGENDRNASRPNQALGLIAALPGKVVALLRQRPGLTDRLMGIFGTEAPAAEETIDPLNAGGATLANQMAPPLAWVWSEYRGIAQPVVEVSPPAPLSGPPLHTTSGNTIDMIRDEIAGFSSTSIAWVWSEYRGAI